MKKIFILLKMLLAMLISTVSIYSQDLNSKEVFPDNEWRLIDENKEMTMKIQSNIVIPLQIITDLDIKATIIDNQRLEVPFKLEMNKDPKKNYKLSYSEKLVDMDQDGRIDVQIISPEYSSSKIIEDNKIIIYGEGIKNDGIYQKRIYMTVELKDGV